jgi:hypothetical protein
MPAPSPFPALLSSIQGGNYQIAVQGKQLLKVPTASLFSVLEPNKFLSRGQSQ